MSESALLSVPASSIAISGKNDRKRFRDEELRQLAESIETHGLIQPITVRPIPRKAGRYELVAGERRFRAMSLLGWKEIPVIVRKLEERTASAVMLAENTGRVQLSPVEEARAFKVRLDQGWSEEEISKTAGVSVDLVRRRVSLLSLMDLVLHLVDTGEFPVGHAEQMVRLDAERQQMVWRIWLRSGSGLTFQPFKEICDRIQAEQDQGALFDLEDFFLQAVENAEGALSGKAAEIGVPTRPDLPPVRQQSGKDSTAAIIQRFAQDLESAGFPAEAGAVNTLLEGLVKLNFVRLPQLNRAEVR